jgi:hypothetical protein
MKGGEHETASDVKLSQDPYQWEGARQSPAKVKEPFGHSSIEITVDIHGHHVPGFNQEAVNRRPWNMQGNHRGNHEVEEDAYERANH